MISDQIKLLMNNGWELRLNIDTDNTTAELYCIATDTYLESIILDSKIFSFEQVFQTVHDIAIDEIPEYYFSLLEDYEQLKQDKKNTLYRIQKEDIYTILSDKNNELAITELFEKQFSCMEEVHGFIENAEYQLFLDKRKQIKNQFEYDNER